MGPAGAETAPPSLALTRELIGSIPQSQRNHCQLADPATEGTIIAGEAASIRAMARCYSVNDLATLWYVLMDSPDSTARLYRKYSGTFDPAAPYRDDDAECPGETTWGFGDVKDDGMLGCYYAATNLDGTPHEESAVLVWTYTAGNILGLAETTHGDADAAALKDWWRDDAGPLSHPTRVKGIADWTVRDRDADKRCSRTCRSRYAAPAWSRTAPPTAPSPALASGRTRWSPASRDPSTLRTRR